MAGWREPDLTTWLSRHIDDSLCLTSRLIGSGVRHPTWDVLLTGLVGEGVRVGLWAKRGQYGVGGLGTRRSVSQLQDRRCVIGHT